MIMMLLFQLWLFVIIGVFVFVAICEIFDLRTVSCITILAFLIVFGTVSTLLLNLAF